VFPGANGGRCIRLTTYYHLVSLSRNPGTLSSWNRLGPSGSVTGLLYLLLNKENIETILEIESEVTEGYFGVTDLV
jgi:hypothetical protein